MNKGLFTHIAATFIYFLFIMYIIGTDDTTKVQRVVIVVCYVFSQFIALAISDTNNFYKQKIS